jgi:hypothetical protein
MFTVDELNNIISDVENNLQTYTDCQKLADLYIIRNELFSHNDVADITAKEFNDILPKFRSYCMIKKKYQLNELPIDTVIHSMEDVCKELFEFITTLYSCTESKQERDCIISMLQELIVKIS